MHRQLRQVLSEAKDKAGNYRLAKLHSHPTWGRSNNQE